MERFRLAKLLLPLYPIACVVFAASLAASLSSCDESELSPVPPPMPRGAKLCSAPIIARMSIRLSSIRRRRFSIFDGSACASSEAPSAFCALPAAAPSVMRISATLLAARSLANRTGMTWSQRRNRHAILHDRCFACPVIATGVRHIAFWLRQGGCLVKPLTGDRPPRRHQ